jgi:hypothetical protein
VERKCRNPCLEPGTCGVNAQCRVNNRLAQCSCPPGFYGNPSIECKQDADECLRNPCGENAKCRDLTNGFECSCINGCQGDAYKGCVCEEAKINLCSSVRCGFNSKCRISSSGSPECYCPLEFPLGDPSSGCKLKEFTYTDKFSKYVNQN